MRRTLCALSLAALAGCTTSQVGGLPSVSKPPASSFSLEFAVGTATIANPDGSSTIGLNVVATYRQANGQNATLANTPTLSGPANFGAGAHSITGVLPSALAAAAKLVPPPLPPGDFGSIVGVYGYGFAPLNFVSTPDYATVYTDAGEECDGIFFPEGSDGIRYDALPLPVELPNCLSVGTAKQYQYYAGPPAWPSPQGYGIPTGSATEYFHGYPLGFTDFENVTPVAGSYSLDVAYSNSPTAQTYAHSDATATLTSVTPLPFFGQPTVRIQDDGSAYVDLNVPATATEAIVVIRSTACARDSSGNALPDRYFSLLTRETGPQTLFLSSNLGPPNEAGTPSDTFCTAADDALPGSTLGHQYDVTAIAFDYPAYEASYPQSTTPKPVVAGANGQADISTSSPLVNQSYSLSAPSAIRHR